MSSRGLLTMSCSFLEDDDSPPDGDAASPQVEESGTLMIVQIKCCFVFSAYAVSYLV